MRSDTGRDRSARGGEAAVQPRAARRDWKTWRLWALLLAGALTVAGFASSLLCHAADAGPPR
ncbi:DUF3999 family protein [Xanthomonas massiliensis]|uniref:DUF3999 family protein n=1 Tax=Xanthomonas massiliensis TaxID=1720302 RepID=UPI003CCCC72A